MTLSQEINSNPYLKVSNCTDIVDIEYAMECLKVLDSKYSENNQTLLNIWAKMIAKKKRLEA